MLASLSHGGPFVLVLPLHEIPDADSENASLVLTKTGKRFGGFPNPVMTHLALSIASQALLHRQSMSISLQGMDLFCVYASSRDVCPVLRAAQKAQERHTRFLLAINVQGGWSFLGEEGFCGTGNAPSREELQERLSAGKQGFSAGTLYQIKGRTEHLVLIGDHPVSRLLASFADMAHLPVWLVDNHTQQEIKAFYPHVSSCFLRRDITEALALVPHNETDYWFFSHNPYGEIEWRRWMQVPKNHAIGILSSTLPHPLFDCGVDYPAGLSLGGNNPAVTALSVMAQVLATLNHADGHPCSHLSRLVIVRGAGDLATGVIIRLVGAGYPVLALETDSPTVIRRTVSFAEALYEGVMTIEGVTGRKVTSLEAIETVLLAKEVPILVDPNGDAIKTLRPNVVVDAILAKRNLGTNLNDAPLVIALGPGFEAGVDCHVVIETMRGHSLGRIIRKGMAIPNTGTPGLIGGFAAERVVHSPCPGIFSHVSGIEIGSMVKKGQTIAMVGDTSVTSQLDGMVRGLLHEGLFVPKGFKVADVDPRGQDADFHTCSDKAKAIAGSVLEVIDAYHHR